MCPVRGLRSCSSLSLENTDKSCSNTNVTDVVVPWGKFQYQLLISKLEIDDLLGGYPKFITQGLNNDYLPIWLQEGGVNTYYVGKFANGHSITNYQTDPAKGWTGSKYEKTASVGY